MTTWILGIFFLGLFCTVANLVGDFGWCTPWWAAILMIAAFRTLHKIWRREEDGEREKLAGRIQNLEDRLKI